MGFTWKLMTAALLCAAAAALAASSLAATATGATVKVGSTGLGRVLVTAQGKTLYLWAGDRGRTSTCYGDCAGYWPPLLTAGKPTAIGGANAKLLGTTKRSDGRLQVTYKGHPLYTFIQDVKRGQTKGEGLTGFGGRWDPAAAAPRARGARPLAPRRARPFRLPPHRPPRTPAGRKPPPRAPPPPPQPRQGRLRPVLPHPTGVQHENCSVNRSVPPRARRTRER